MKLQPRPEREKQVQKKLDRKSFRERVRKRDTHTENAYGWG